MHLYFTLLFRVFMFATTNGLKNENAYIYSNHELAALPFLHILGYAVRELPRQCIPCQ
jgi:hypothetical protein